jgi:hypothetical protein
MFQTVAPFDTPSTSHFVLSLAVLFILTFLLTVVQTSNLHQIPTKGHKTAPTWHCRLQTELGLYQHISAPQKWRSEQRVSSVNGREGTMERQGSNWQEGAAARPQINSRVATPIVGSSISHRRGASAFRLLPAASSRHPTSDQGKAAHMCSCDKLSAMCWITPQAFRSLLGAIN